MMAKKYGVSLLFEAFADRAYTDDGGLMERSQDGSVYTTPEQMVAQVKEVVQGHVTTPNGNTIPLKADSICVHGDNEASIVAARQIYQSLRS